MDEAARQPGGEAPEAGGADGTAPGRLAVVGGGLAFPFSAFQVRTSRSSGPGGQHVNKVETRVEVLLDVARLPGVGEETRERLLARLGSRLEGEGVLRVVSERYRSQLRNREDALERALALLREALRPEKPRRPTRVSRGAIERRLAAKRQRAQTKQMRRPRPDEG